jgi:hypothetical protein
MCYIISPEERKLLGIKGNIRQFKDTYARAIHVPTHICVRCRGDVHVLVYSKSKRMN